MRRQPRARPRRRHRGRRLRRVQHHRQCGGGGQAHPCRRRWHGRADRRAVEPISARARSRPAVPRARAQRRHGRFSRLRLHFHAAELAVRFAGSARSRHPSVRRRGGRPHGRRFARRRRRQRQAYLQLSGRHAGDAGRGCPFQCSFCTIINVQGRKSRYRTPDDVEAIVRANAAQGITRFFVTDDNFARNKNWEPILDRLIELREQHDFNIKLLLQVDTLCHRIPNFIPKAARAGCTAVFIGLENINPESLMGTKKRQNKIWEYRDMLQAWRRAKVITYAGYILGFPTDTPESIARDIEIIKQELPVDFLEFFYLTPLPGSEDHKNLFTRGVPMDPDMNKYDLEHACTAHPLMSKETWMKVYADAWTRYYTDAHAETIMRRAVVSGINRTKILDSLTIFSGASRIEGVHPLQFGFFRRKLRTQRRSGKKVLNPLIFYPWRLFDFLKVCSQWLRLVWRYRRIMARVKADPASRSHFDEALRPHTAGGETDHFVEMFADKIPHTHGAPARATAAVG